MESKGNPPSYIRPPDEKILESLAALQDNGHFNRVIQWLLDSSGDVDAQLRILTDTASIYRAQSASNNIFMIIKYAGMARAEIKRIKEKESGSVLSKREPKVAEKGFM